MPDYSRGKIYEIVCRKTGEKYVGSTTLKYLSMRLAGHRTLKERSCSKQIIERGDYYINLLEDFPCESKGQLLKREREWYDKCECINIQRPYISQCEKNLIKQNWVDRNLEKVNDFRREMVTCECGNTYRRSNKSLHIRTNKHIKSLSLI